MMLKNTTTLFSPRLSRAYTAAARNDKARPLRPAASVIMTRDNKTPSSAYNYEIMMIQRSKGSNFFAGAFAFPGGVIEEADFDPKWKDMLGDSAKDSENVRVSLEEKELNELGFRIGATREVFEEVNILLGQTKDRAAVTNAGSSWRPLVHNDAKEYHRMCTEMAVRPLVEKLVPFSHWTTPVSEGGSRYNTLFYLFHGGEEEFGTAGHDNVETINMRWLCPRTALNAFDAGEIFLPPPTWVMIHEMSQYKSIHGLMESMKGKNFGSGIYENMPVLMRGDRVDDKVREEVETKFHINSSDRQIVRDKRHKDGGNEMNRVVVTTSKEAGDRWKYMYWKGSESKL
ncbi:NUDIX hydrolase [Planoprotostelium fungivorum]|uniref:NUDIX hydrolase n=1 Tax=Planoprotostelium fungivorum TaxID=1890364 RepID=A0A2P6MU25_9EUKA|nr:NUDIX hydrolase [Planoprotostelium fungivorum]PRP84241.1 NUDIX hydrolase [Planoprotostelium fungivorum]